MSTDFLIYCHCYAHSERFFVCIYQVYLRLRPRLSESDVVSSQLDVPMSSADHDGEDTEKCLIIQDDCTVLAVPPVVYDVEIIFSRVDRFL